MRKVPAVLLLFICLACSAGPKEHRVQVLESYPHDRAAYTQGLFFHSDTLYETTGQYGESSLRKVDLQSGKVLEKVKFSRKYFAEGSCV